MEVKKYILLGWLVLFFCFTDCSKKGVNPPSDSGIYGSVYITSVPSEADIYLDGNFTRKTTPDTLYEIPVGNHLITVRKPGYIDYQKKIYVSEEVVNVKAILIVPEIEIYWSVNGQENLGYAWVPKKGQIQLGCRDRNRDPVNDVVWHFTDSTIISISPEGVVTGWQDLFDREGIIPRVDVWAQKDSMISNTIVVEGIVNLSGEWFNKEDSFAVEIIMYCEPSWATNWWVAGLFHSYFLEIVADSLYWRNPRNPENWVLGVISNKGRKVEIEIHNKGEVLNYTYIKLFG